MKLIYHSADNDGHCSGAILKHRHPDGELIGYNYGEQFPFEKIKGEEVIMADVSLQPFSAMKRLAEECGTLLWIDHHKSAIEEMEQSQDGFGQPTGKVQTVMDTSYSACELCWRTFYPSIPMPKAVLWLGRYDIWKHAEHPGALEFQYGIRLYDTRPENQAFWSKLFGFAGTKADTEQIRQEGELLLRYETMQNERFARAFSFECRFAGLNCIAVNRGFTNSLVFKSVLDPARHDAMLSFCWRGGQWTVSLYTDKPEVDVSDVARRFGGGGHRGAAGFQTHDIDIVLTGIE